MMCDGVWKWWNVVGSNQWQWCWFVVIAILWRVWQFPRMCIGYPRSGIQQLGLGVASAVKWGGSLAFYSIKDSKSVPILIAPS
jgi:hypothetical protein